MTLSAIIKSVNKFETNLATVESNGKIVLITDRKGRLINFV